MEKAYSFRFYPTPEQESLLRRTLGCKVQVVDYAPTNFNLMQGVKLLKTALSSSVEIHDVNLDSQFLLPEKSYSLVIFLGILYHLKNPYYALETLAKSANYCLILNPRKSKPDSSVFPLYSRLFGLCYAMDGGYKGWNPYIEKHLAIFVNCFCSRAN